MSVQCKKQDSSRVLQLSLSITLLVYGAPCCPTISSLQQRLVFLPADLMLFVRCDCVLLMVHLLSFILVMQPAHFCFTSETYSTMSVSLVLCFVMVFQILSFNLTFHIYLSVAHWLVLSFYTAGFVRNHVWP